MKTRWLPWLLFCFSLFLFSCEKTDIITGGENDTPPASGINKTVLLQMVNDVRQQGCNCGTTYMPPVSPVSWNSQLEAAALAHATDMYRNNYFSHTGLDGSNAGTRIRKAGYDWRTYGENIARGYLNEQSVVNGWIQSPGHCRNIMDGLFREMGVARAGNYWVQEFAAR